MTRRWLSWTFASIGGVLLIVVLALLWVLNTQSGTRAALGMVQNAMKDSLRVENIEGAIAGPLSLRGLRYVDPVTGLSVAAKRIDVDPKLLALFKTRVHIVSADIRGIDIELGTQADPLPEEEDKQPFTLQAPIDIVVERFGLRDAVVRRAQDEVVRVDVGAFSGSWIGTNVTVRQLDVRSPDGEIYFAGKVQEADTYIGDGVGRFRWRAGESTYAGTIRANAEANDARVRFGLTAPLRADLNIDLQQQDTLPWKMALSVPAFDPRDELMPDSALQSLAAELHGSGTLERGALQGEVVINGESVTFERLAFDRTEELLNIDSRMLLGGGTFEAKTTLELTAEPVAAAVDAQWDKITVPEQWAGQVLMTEGKVAFEGSAASYRVNGGIRLGPPERIANIELAMEGSPSEVNVRQFDIVQRDGRLAAAGVLNLQPHIGWSFNATAKSFDPGDFAAEWPGDLNFALKTEGMLADAGPEANVQLSNLRGRLRGRAISGTADMQLASNKNVVGHADLRSGASRVQLQAKSGETMDAIARIDIPALDDWVPNAGGSLRGTFSALGKWPNVTIDGQARGTALRFGDMRAESLQLNMDMENPTEPEGSVVLRVQDAVAAGMKLTSVRADASGAAASHTLELDVQGSPLGTDLALEGSLADGGWRGTVNRLVLDIEDAARLSLQQPVEVEYLKEGTRISEACFADGDIRLCFDGAMRADSSLDAHYSLSNVPLALANAFAPADSALAFDGTIRGDGRVQRNAEGELSGTVLIESARGEIARELAEGEEPQVLLTFADLNIHASLEGDRAQARLAARLNETGSLQGQLAASGLSQPAAELDGSIAAQLPSIAIVEVFAPQLANVQGAVDLRVGVQGRADDPAITGALRLSNLSTDVPEFGLQLRNGSIAVTPRTDRGFDLEGSIQSGDGHLAFAGTARTEGASTISINGKQFLAADMPGARVLIEPALDVQHVPERVTIKGQVRIPEAAVNLQELPGGGGGGARASSDVVIVDAKTQEEAAAEALPIYADVTVVLGDEVELAGFGLLAQVAGQLAVRERPGEPTAGSGEIRVAGQYKAYGQDLTIQQGSLLFANSPLDNPNLRIVATRQVGEVTAGLRVSGNAKSPVLTVFSDPEMGQANALSYLVAGKPLDAIGQSEGEGDALQTAARSLGTAAGGLIAKNIGKRFGVDEIGIKENEMIGGSAFTIGQYLSPRLFLSYGVGLFEPGEVVTLRYKLSEAFAIQAQSGSEESRAGVQYRIER